MLIAVMTEKTLSMMYLPLDCVGRCRDRIVQTALLVLHSWPDMTAYWLALSDMLWTNDLIYCRDCIYSPCICMMN